MIGICSPIGTVKKPLIDQIKQQLERDYKYTDVKVWKLSKFISDHVKSKPSYDSGFSKGYIGMMTKIDGGDQLRKENKKNSILVEMVIAEILRERSNDGTLDKAEDMSPRRVCHIIDSLKNVEELLLLRAIYKDIFYMFSVFSPEQERREFLLTEKKLNKEKGEVDLLINTDEHENNKHGQNVRDTFVEADFFVRISRENTGEVSDKVKRYLQLIFSTSVITPTPHEKAMYAAKSAATNSACLSRQVGASITDSKYNLLSTGWNDVPKFLGNLYQEGDKKDMRCFHYKEYCRNDRQKDNIVGEILNELFKDKELVKKIFKDDNIEKNKDLSDKLTNILRKQTPIKDLIEFSRAVHAEMHAIIAGSQKTGEQMIGGKLYCTTYPCHNCARHIIASGITEVYYIEPYVKSLCKTLHDDVITENEDDINKVKVLLYDGVAPRRFLEFFTLSRERKGSDGAKRVYNTMIQSPKYRLTLQALPTLERYAIESLEESGIVPNENDNEQSEKPV